MPTCRGRSRPLLSLLCTYPLCKTLRTRFANCTALSASTQQTTLMAFFIISGDFNHANLKTFLPKFYQRELCNKRKQHIGLGLHNRKKGVQSCTLPPSRVLRPHLCYANSSIQTTSQTCQTGLKADHSNGQKMPTSALQDCFQVKSSQVKLSFIVIPLLWGHTVEGNVMPHRTTVLHKYRTYNNEVKHYKPIHKLTY